MQHQRGKGHVLRAGADVGEGTVGERDAGNVRRVGKGVLLIGAVEARIVINAVAGADGSLAGAEGIPGEADAGSEVLNGLIADVSAEGRAFATDDDAVHVGVGAGAGDDVDRKSTRLNSSHLGIS